MKILIADEFPLGHRQILEKKHHEFLFDPQLTAMTLPQAINDYETLIVRSTVVDENTLAQASALKLIIRAGAGFNTIATQFAAHKGVRVCNVPGKNAVAVAELTMGLLISMDRRIPDCVADLRENRWNKSRYSRSEGLFGRSIGIVGLGAIGQEVAARVYAFGMQIYYIDRPSYSATLRNQLNRYQAHAVSNIEQLAQDCEILTFHVPATSHNQEMVNKRLLDLMPPKAILINTSRGNLVDESALIEAMNQKGIHACVDVYQNEPTTGNSEFQSELATHPNVYGTHHIGASTNQAQTAVADGVIQIIEEFEQGRLLNCVNKLD